MNLLHMTEDIESAISLKTTSMISSLSDKSVKAILGAFEFQFDYVIADRSLVLHNVSKLYTILLKNKRKILNWDFFLNRFDTLFLEDQLILQELYIGEIISPTSLTGYNADSEHFNRKLNLIRYALESADEIAKLNTNTKIKGTFETVKRDSLLELSSASIKKDKRISSIGTLADTVSLHDQ
ncbi:hypothetical protein GJ496_008125 [Pomphorhynchus laevis]|nr:hypothetical protein GJ496_008125 [Pomphorhynchus laevis]